MPNSAPASRSNGCKIPNLLFVVLLFPDAQTVGIGRMPCKVSMCALGLVCDLCQKDYHVLLRGYCGENLWSIISRLQLWYMDKTQVYAVLI